MKKMRKSENVSVPAEKTSAVNEIAEKVLTDENKKKAKRGLKIAAIILAVDFLSAIIYFCTNGFPE